MKIRHLALSLLATSVFSSVSHAEEGKWVQLFNGKDLTGWSPKIKGYPAGENFANTFSVKDGAITVNYDGYNNEWGNRYGHLYYTGKKFSNYKLHIEYRFIGEQIKGGAGWALRNSGVMIHSESINTMGLNQDFPASIEVQMLGGTGKGERGTANCCTPGTNIVKDGQLITAHTINAKPQVTINGDEWVSLDVEVHGNGVIKHFVNGQQVHEYEKAQLDERDGHAKELMAKGAPMMLSEGYLCLQSESHPCQFRKVEIMELDK